MNSFRVGSGYRYVTVCFESSVDFLPTMKKNWNQVSRFYTKNIIKAVVFESDPFKYKTGLNLSELEGNHELRSRENSCFKRAEKEEWVVKGSSRLAFIDKIHFISDDIVLLF